MANMASTAILNEETNLAELPSVTILSSLLPILTQLIHNYFDRVSLKTLIREPKKGSRSTENGLEGNDYSRERSHVRDAKVSYDISQALQ